MKENKFGISKNNTYNDLEILVDRVGIPYALQMLSLICKEKAAQKDVKHDYYDSCAKELEDLADKIKKVKVNAKY